MAMRDSSHSPDIPQHNRAAHQTVMRSSGTVSALLDEHGADPEHGVGHSGEHRDCERDADPVGQNANGQREERADAAPEVVGERLPGRAHVCGELLAQQRANGTEGSGTERGR